MKTLLFLFISSCTLFAQSPKVVLANLPENEVGILINLKQDNSFQEYFLFQYNGNILDVTMMRNLTLVKSDANSVTFTDQKKNYVFTIDSSYRNSNEVVYYGFGLSRKKADYRLVVPNTPISTLLEAIMFNRSITGDITCYSGGVGSTECSIDSSAITGGGGCSVKCSGGYYACCDDTKNECRCNAAPKKKKTLQISPY